MVFDVFLCHLEMDLACGKLLHNYGTSPFMGKLTNFLWPFSIAIFDKLPEGKMDVTGDGMA